MSSTTQLPRWRLDTIFPDLDSQSFRESVRGVKDEITALEGFMDDRQVRSDAQPGADAEEVLEELLLRLGELITRYRDLSAYLYGRVSTDAYDEAAQAERSALQPWGSRLGMLLKRTQGWAGKLDHDALTARSEVARDHRYLLERSKVAARHLLGHEAEEMASTLDPFGGGAWSRLHTALISRETIEVALPGRPEAEYNVAELKQLQYESDPALREEAYRAELELLGRNAVSFAAAMNSIKGQVGELARRRGWSDPLEESLFQNGIDRASLEAMQQACRESFPTFRRYMKAKASALGKERLAWYDLVAPLETGEGTRYGWDEARSFIVDHFGRYSSRLASFADRAFVAGWMDAPSRKGKTNGAYCMSVPGRKESRILLNFGGRLDDLFTIAHELGHAFHNDCMYRYGRGGLQRSTPMTLAETASIFCETLIVNAILGDADEGTRLAVLEQDLVSTNQLVIDIYSRFLFERETFERRAERELSISELEQNMLQAQEATYGEALEPDLRHPLMWAHKGHYYSSSFSFYNYPYTFGLLFGLGLYRVFRDEPHGFQERYEELLSTTGMAGAASLGERFGIDIADPGFWRGSLAIFDERVSAYEDLVSRRASSA